MSHDAQTEPPHQFINSVPDSAHFTENHLSTRMIITWLDE
jgi:hypothetical protein